MRKKEIFFLTGFVICLCLTLHYSNHIFSYKAPYGITQFEAFYEQEKDSIDVLFVGTSHVYSDINPAVLWEQNGIAAYNLATGGAGLWNSYYAVREALKTQSPRLIVLELYGAISQGEYRTNREIMDANWGIKNPLTRWESLQISAPEASRVPFLLQFPYYHTRYKDIKKEDFEPYTHNYTYGNQEFFLYPALEKKAYKGAVTLSHITKYDQMPNLTSVTDTMPISEKSEYYLNEIIRLAESKKIPLLLLVSPYMGCSPEHQKKYNYIEQIARERHINYINYNNCFTELGFNSQTDFAETSHLSYLGMKKYSQFLGNYLTEQYNLSDHRGEKKWESWDTYGKWERQVFSNFNLADIENISEYFGSLNNPNYFVIVSFDSISDVQWDQIEFFRKAGFHNLSECIMIQRDGKQLIFSWDENLEKVCHGDIGSSNYAITFEGGRPKVRINKQVFKKVDSGIHVMVYDTYVDSIVDVVGFDAKRDFMAVR